jgi:hypothetical protein
MGLDAESTPSSCLLYNPTNPIFLTRINTSAWVQWKATTVHFYWRKNIFYPPPPNSTLKIRDDFGDCHFWTHNATHLFEYFSVVGSCPSWHQCEHKRNLLHHIILTDEIMNWEKLLEGPFFNQPKSIYLKDQKNQHFIMSEKKLWCKVPSK